MTTATKVQDLLRQEGKLHMLIQGHVHHDNRRGVLIPAIDDAEIGEAVTQFARNLKPGREIVVIAFEV